MGTALALRYKGESAQAEKHYFVAVNSKRAAEVDPTLPGVRDAARAALADRFFEKTLTTTGRRVTYHDASKASSWYDGMLSTQLIRIELALRPPDASGLYTAEVIGFSPRQECLSEKRNAMVEACRNWPRIKDAHIEALGGTPEAAVDGLLAIVEKAPF